MEFEHTIGHEKQKKLILRAIQNGQLSHGYVFVGPENVGKTTFALDLGEILGADPILDLVVSDTEEGLAIEEVRSIQNRLSLTPVGEIKVAVIAKAEKMTVEAANSLLKLLEEPPAHSLLILVTSNFYGLLPTVSSRLQRLNFGWASEKELASAIADLKLEKEKAKKIVKLSLGRIGLAKRLSRDQKFLDFVEQIENTFQVFASGSVSSRLMAAYKIAELETFEIENFLKFTMRRWIQTHRPEDLGEKLLLANRDLRFNVNTKLVLDNLFI